MDNYLLNPSDEDKRADFLAEARASRKEMLESGKGYGHDEVHAYIRSRVAGIPTSRPKLKSWRM